MTPENQITQEPVEKQEQPNIIYSSDPQFREPPAFVRIGMTVIDLPDAETQRRGFYSPHARRLIRSVSGYKRLKTLGEK